MSSSRGEEGRGERGDAHSVKVFIECCGKAVSIVKTKGGEEGTEETPVRCGKGVCVGSEEVEERI